MEPTSNRTSPLAWFSLLAGIAWCVVVSVAAVCFARTPEAYQNWWMLPYMWGATVGWLPFTGAGVVTGGLALRAIKRRPEELGGARWAWAGIVLGIAAPAVGFAGLYLAGAVREALLRT